MSRDRDDLEAMLVETGWVRALARRLCADASTADDLAQDAWVAALEHPPRDPSAARSWLARVVANLARERGRSEAARRGRERSLARDERTDDDVVARADASRSLVDAVLALEEPYRSTLLAHYFDGLAPREIARRTGTNASTVRTRLERGLAKLRDRLARDGGATWLSALAPLASGPAPHPLAGLKTPALKTTALKTVIAMTTATKIGIALAGALVVLWLATSSSSDGIVEVAPVGPAPVRVALAAEASGSAVDASEWSLARQPIEPLGPSSDPAVERPGPTPEAAVKAGFLEGIVLRGETFVAGGSVWIWRGHVRSIPRDLERERGPLVERKLERFDVGRDGRFRIGPLDPSWYTLGYDAGSGVGPQLTVEMPADGTGNGVVIVLGECRVVGRVHDLEGRPVAGAAIRASRTGNSIAFERYAYSDAEGRYVLEDLEARPWWFSVDRAGRIGQEGRSAGTEDARQIVLVAGATRTIDFGEPVAAEHVRLRIVQRDGALVPYGGLVLWTDVATDAYSQTKLEPGGTVDLRLSPGEYRMQVRLWTTTAGFGTDYLPLGPITVRVGDGERELVLDGTSVRVAVVGFAADAAAKAAHVELHGEPGAPAHYARVEPDGRALFVAVPPGRYRLVGGGGLVLASEEAVEVQATDISLSLRVAPAPR